VTVAAERLDIPADAARFIVAGAINTALTILVYEVAMSFLPASLSYGIAWLVGIGFLMIVYPEKVFPGGRTRVTDRLFLAASYALIFVLGLGVLRIATMASVSPRIAIVIAVIVTTAANFFSSRTILRR